MHLISPLISGIRGAENGTATLYKRGTATRATYYSDFYATGGVTTDVALDANGGASVYVNELVDVTVKDSTGTTVRAFTAGDAAPAVEVISQSFTGHDYTTGAAGASKPTTLQAVLDAWKDSAGAIDFKVLLNGSATNLSVAIGALSFYNVKSSAYGALGDGSTDDTAAIAAAIAAANGAGGGTVFFPPGTYRVTAALSLTAGVSLQGSGADASHLYIDHATADLVVPTAGTARRKRFIADLHLAGLQANTGKLVNVNVAAWLTIQRVTFGGQFSNGSLLDLGAAATAAYVACYGCVFVADDTATKCVAIAGLRSLVLEECVFVLNATVSVDVVKVANSLTGAVRIQSCVFDWSASTTMSATSAGLFVGQSFTGPISVTNCDFPETGGATVLRCMRVDSTQTKVLAFSESGNRFGTESGFSPYPFEWTATAFATDDVNIRLASREARASSNTAGASTATNTYSPYLYRAWHHKRTTNGVAHTIVLSTDWCPPGTRFTLIYENSSGGTTGTVTFDGATVRADAMTFTVNTVCHTVFEFVLEYLNSVAKWTLVSRNANITT